jgi:hypothetical protein
VAVIRNPMFGQIQGTVGAVTFCVGSGKTVVRAKTSKKVKHNQNQINHSSLFKAAKNQWNTYSSVEKSQWLLKARISGTKLNGYQYFIKITLSGEREMPTNPTLASFTISIDSTQFNSLSSSNVLLGIEVEAGHMYFPAFLSTNMISNGLFTTLFIGKYYEPGSFDNLFSFTVIRTLNLLNCTPQNLMLACLDENTSLYWDGIGDTPVSPEGFTTLDLTIFYFDYTL